jgi:nucleotide-binding universal stress UspA family protein
MRTRTILIPLDGSVMAEAAIAQARQLAGSDAATFLLVRAANVLALPGTHLIDAQIGAVREAEEYLASLRRRLEREGARGIETHVWYGPAAPAIVEAARLYGVDLIVMSTHGRSGLGRLVFGSVAESVLRGTTVPILLVRPRAAPVQAPVGHEATGPASPTGVPAREEATR